MNAVDGLNLKRGPPLMAIKGWRSSSKLTMAASPDGVSWRMVTLEIPDLGKSEQ